MDEKLAPKKKGLGHVIL